MIGLGVFACTLAFCLSVRSAIGAENLQRADRIAATFPSLSAVTSNALARKHHLDMAPKLYASRVREDAQRLGLPPPNLDRMRQVQRYHHVVRQPTILESGRKYSFGALEVTALDRRVAMKKGGTSVKTKHTIAKVRNAGSTPVAYFVDLHLRQEPVCSARGVFQLNALALRPGEEATITVCSRSGAVEMTDLRYLEISEIGYHYVSALPARAFPLDNVTASAHRGEAPCSLVPASRLLQSQRQGTIGWEDIVDFFSRHSCHAYAMPDGYRYQRSPLAQLPFGASTSLDDALARKTDP